MALRSLLASGSARRHRRQWFTLFQPHLDPNMYGSTVIGIPSEAIGGGIEVIGLERHMWALVGGRLAMSAGGTLKVTGKEIAGGGSVTSTGPRSERGAVARRRAASLRQYVIDGDDNIDDTNHINA